MEESGSKILLLHLTTPPLLPKEFFAKPGFVTIPVTFGGRDAFIMEDK